MIDIAEWAAEAVGRLDPDKELYYESIALDQVLGDAFVLERAVEQAWDAYRDLVLSSGGWGRSVMPRLVFPLADTTAFALADSLGNDPLSDLDEFRVPDLALTVRTLGAFLFAPGWEEYRMRVPFAVPELAGLPPIVTSYVCHRNEQARRDGEFYRELWFDQHPWVAPGG